MHQYNAMNCMRTLFRGLTTEALVWKFVDYAT